MKENKTICEYICELAEEEAIRSNEFKTFSDVKWLLKNVESIIKSHFIEKDNKIIFDNNFDEVEQEILHKFITEK